MPRTPYMNSFCTWGSSNFVCSGMLTVFSDLSRLSSLKVSIPLRLCTRYRTQWKGT